MLDDPETVCEQLDPTDHLSVTTASIHVTVAIVQAAGGGVVAGVVAIAGAGAAVVAIAGGAAGGGWEAYVVNRPWERF